MKEKLTELKEAIDNSTVTGELSTLLSIIDNTKGKVRL